MAGRILIITDGPAAITHTVELLRLLKNDHFTVKVAPTGYDGASALSFSTELTWSLLSGHPCLAVDKLDHDTLSASDVIVLAPVSKAVLEVFTRGKALELLQSCHRPVIACPARLSSDASQPDYSAWLAKLAPHSRIVLPSRQEKLLPLGAMGAISIASPRSVFEAIQEALSRHLLTGKKFLLTAGPTAEDFDPVRFISNRSSGKMGLALALEARRQGASVTLVHGPVSIELPSVDGLKYIPVRSALQMYNEVMSHQKNADAAILCAAVADFTPTKYSMQKIKKQDGIGLTMELERTHDILKEMGNLPNVQRPFLVGFAAESDNVDKNAVGKLYKKHCNMLCSNDITAQNCGFAVDTNQVVIYDEDGSIEKLPLLSKSDTAARIIAHIAMRLEKTSPESVQ